MAALAGAASRAAARYGRQHHARPAALLAASVEHAAARASGRADRLACLGARMRRRDPARGGRDLGGAASRRRPPRRDDRPVGAAPRPVAARRRRARCRSSCRRSSRRRSTIAIVIFATRLKARYRHGSQAFRLMLMTLGLLVPAFAFYPSMFQLGWQAKSQLVETRYAPAGAQPAPDGPAADAGEPRANRSVSRAGRARRPRPPDRTDARR